MITHDSEYLTIREAAEALRVSVPTVRRWIRSGRLSAYRVGKRSIRVRRNSLHDVSVPIEPRAIDVAQLMERLCAADEAILAKRGGKTFDSSVPLIREARLARDDRL